MTTLKRIVNPEKKSFVVFVLNRNFVFMGVVLSVQLPACGCIQGVVRTLVNPGHVSVPRGMSRRGRFLKIWVYTGNLSKDFDALGKFYAGLIRVQVADAPNLLSVVGAECGQAQGRCEIRDGLKERAILFRWGF